MTQNRPHILFDLSRLLWRSERFAPTGIDRVELAYARHLIATSRHRLSFVAWWGRLGPLPDDRAIAFVETLDALWSGRFLDPDARHEAAAMARRLRVHVLLRGERALHARARRAGDRLIYLLVSHYRLHRPAALRRIKAQTGARLVCLVHDVIPIEYPEHVERGDPERHRQRVNTVAELADAVIVNSRGTAAALQRHFARAGGDAPVLVAPLGIDLRPAAGAPPVAADRPYFICVATIEPRKNHRLLFAIWQRVAEGLGEAAPRLVLVGHRGWQSKRILGEVDRSPVLRGLIEHHQSLPDAAVVRLLAGARALLYASFAEGYGLPVAEALAMRVPVLCSDLAELREVGKAVPEYLDPGDEAAWRGAIVDYARPGSPRRKAQLARLDEWRAPNWGEHFARVAPLLDGESPLLAAATAHEAGRAMPAGSGSLRQASRVAAPPATRPGAG